MAEDRDPLWQVMDDAYDADTPYRQCYANMIRAMRDYLVPDEDEWLRVAPATHQEALLKEAKRDERKRLRDILSAQAVKAEAPT